MVIKWKVTNKQILTITLIRIIKFILKQSEVYRNLVVVWRGFNTMTYSAIEVLVNYDFIDLMRDLIETYLLHWIQARQNHSNRSEV